MNKFNLDERIDSTLDEHIDYWRDNHRAAIEPIKQLIRDAIAEVKPNTKAWKKTGHSMRDSYFDGWDASIYELEDKVKALGL